MMNRTEYDEVYLTKRIDPHTKPIEDSGWWDKTRGGFNINYSSVLTRLIQEAGRWCERYASDLFVSWDILSSEIVDTEPNWEIEEEINCYYFGFREDGVDHLSFILSHLNQGCSREYYRSVWVLTCTRKEDNLTMTLNRIRL